MKGRVVMMARMSLWLGLFALFSWQAVAAENLSDRLSAAKPGTTVTLPAGEFHGGVTLPPGVSLKGAGVGKTIVTGGLTVSGGKGAQISDLTVKDAGIVVKNAESITITRVRVTGATTGIAFNGVKQGRIENCVSDENRFGIAIGGGADCVVVNCTVTQCPEMGISVAACPNAVVFNNCIVGSAVCLNIDKPAAVRVDHNLYFGMYVGQMQEQFGKKMLTAWQYLTGLDKHSVQMAVEFGDHFTVTNVLPWSLDRAVTADWGAAEFAGVKAPSTDLTGRPRAGRPDVGTVETVIKVPRAADGKFTVANNAGVKSVGVFRKDGFLVTYLFHNLPLPKGEHAFWLPARDYVGQPIPAGDYEMRLAESDFQWTYLDHIADNGDDGAMAYSASRSPRFAVFAPDGAVVQQSDHSEDHTGLRAYDPVTGKLRWYVYGAAYSQGITVGKDGLVYYLYGMNRSTGESRLSRVDANGKIVPFPGSPYGHVFPILTASVRSLAALGDRLYTADAESNQLFVITMADGQIEKTLDVPAPKYVAADESTQLLWVVSGESLVALSPDGNKLAESKAVAEPLAVAARNGTLAVASGATGKVHVFDARDPKNLKPLREVGRGDGPYGPLTGDRFGFQTTDGPREDWLRKTSVALDAEGRLAVTDAIRMLVLDPRGQPLWHTVGVFGNSSPPSYATELRRFWDTEGEFSFWLNEQDGTWKMDAHWDHTQIGVEFPESKVRLLGDFAIDGKTFTVFVHWPPRGKHPKLPVLTVARLDKFVSVPVLKISLEDNKLFSREDSNGDGQITDADTATPLVDAQGKPLTAHPIGGQMYLQPDGSFLRMSFPSPWLWKCSGLNAQGVPVYAGKDYGQTFFHADWRKDLSPYDFLDDYCNTSAHGFSQGGNGLVGMGWLSDGGFVLQAFLRNSGESPGTSGTGTDLCGYSADGRRRWVHQLAQWRGIGGLGTVDDITLTVVHSQCAPLAVDADGLGLGGFCEAAQLKYPGYLIDHPNMKLFKLPDDRIYLTYGDNASGRHPWYRLDNQQSLKKTTTAFRLDEARAKALAATEWKPAFQAIRPPPPRVRVPRLAKALPIDGDLEKWRTAGIEPAIFIGPSHMMDGPGDCSGVVRVAYEGKNLYFQVLRFDDVVTFHQRSNMFQQDALELALNGTHPNGFQFIVYKNPHGEDLIHRHRFFQKAIKARKIAPEHAPRIVRVLDNAADVPERAALEQLYGVDLSPAKVIVTEFMLPMDDNVWAEAEADAIDLKPGTEFWLGFFLDDNDQPYTDKQELSWWPATFGMFSPREDGAIAVCE
jgi:parallel beta-helix repeat protein